MVSIKLKAKAVEQKSGFEPYDGPEPSRRGFYRAVIKKFQYRKNNGGSYGFFIVLELEAEKGDPKDHARYDGYPMFSRSIITESADGEALKEGAERNLSNLLAALNTGDDPSVVLEKGGDPDSGPVDVLKIGTRNPVGAVVNVDMGFETYNNEQRPQVSGLFKFKGSEDAGTKASKPSFEDDEDEADLMEGGDEEASEVDVRAEELSEMGVAELRKLAKELGAKSSGTKQAVVEAILEAEFPEDEDADEESDDEDEPEEAEEDEAEEAEDDDAEEDDEEEDSEEAARSAELEEFDRLALKKILKAAAPDFTVLKRHTDDDLREAILNAEFGEDTPF